MIFSESEYQTTTKTSDRNSGCAEGHMTDVKPSDTIDDRKIENSGNFADLNNDAFYSFDDAETITFSDTDTEPYDSPLYQNQEGDPKVQDLIWQQNMEDM